MVESLGQYDDRREATALVVLQSTATNEVYIWHASMAAAGRFDVGQPLLFGGTAIIA